MGGYHFCNGKQHRAKLSKKYKQYLNGKRIVCLESR